MLASASPAGMRKSLVASSFSRCRSQRCNLAAAYCGDSRAAPAPATFRRGDEQGLREVGSVAAGLSAAAAHLIAANLAWASVPSEALTSLQAAEPLTELSEANQSATDGAPAPALVEVADEAPLGATPISTPVELPAEPAAPSPVLPLDIPAMPAISSDTDIQTLVAALVRNESFVSALVGNEAFLDRLAGEERVLQELARRSGLGEEVETRRELSTELRRRQAVLGALSTRGQEAVMAVAGEAARAAEEAGRAAAAEARQADVTGEVGVVSGGRSALVSLGAAVELLEDSQELLRGLQEAEGSGPGQLSGQGDFQEMEAAVARAEMSVSGSLQRTAGEPLPAIQGAVRELYSVGDSRDGNSYKAMDGSSSNGSSGPTISRAYNDLVAAVAEMQAAYGRALSRAVGHAVAEVVEVEAAAAQGAEKTRALLGQRLFGW